MHPFVLHNGLDVASKIVCHIGSRLHRTVAFVGVVSVLLHAPSTVAVHEHLSCLLKLVHGVVYSR